MKIHVVEEEKATTTHCATCHKGNRTVAEILDVTRPSYTQKMGLGDGGIGRL